MSRVFWDTNLFIYLFERHPVFFGPVNSLWQGIQVRQDKLFTSVMTVGEIQVGPRRARNFAEARSYPDAIRRTCTILPYTEAAADLYAQIRENPAISSPDAIQLSCAASAGVDLFITNDRGLQRLTVPGIEEIASLDRLSL